MSLPPPEGASQADCPGFQIASSGRGGGRSNLASSASACRIASRGSSGWTA